MVLSGKVRDMFCEVESVVILLLKFLKFLIFHLNKDAVVPLALLPVAISVCSGHTAVVDVITGWGN